MTNSFDEVYEWSLEMSKKYKYHPMKFIGDVEILVDTGISADEAMKRTERRMEEETNGKEKA